MKKYTVFVDGAVGTTGLRIHERLETQPDITLLVLDEASRKNLGARVQAANSADVSILCLPDDASKELAQAVQADTRLIDASTAHRTNPAWVYGFPELGQRHDAIASATRVAVPGCHATGFLSLAAPLVEKGLLASNFPLVCNSLTGYSGGGKAMIAAYEDAARPAGYNAPRLYALGMAHKHLPEMQAVAGISAPPLFTPVVDDYYSGMLVTLPLPLQALAAGYQSVEAVAGFFAEYYANQPFITVHPAGEADADGTLPANALSGRDGLEIFILGSAEQLLLAARFDNLGKGASGAAVQCMNLMLGRPQTIGLVL